MIPRSSLISGRIGEPSHSQPNPWKELTQLLPAGEQIAQFGGKKAVQIQQPITDQIGGTVRGCRRRVVAPCDQPSRLGLHAVASLRGPRDWAAGLLGGTLVYTVPGVLVPAHPDSGWPGGGLRDGGGAAAPGGDSHRWATVTG